MRELSPQEIVDKACTIAELVANKCREKGWFIDVPTLAEARKILKPDKVKSPDI